MPARIEFHFRKTSSRNKLLLEPQNQSRKSKQFIHIFQNFINSY